MRTSWHGLWLGALLSATALEASGQLPPVAQDPEPPPNRESVEGPSEPDSPPDGSDSPPDGSDSPSDAPEQAPTTPQATQETPTPGAPENKVPLQTEPPPSSPAVPIADQDDDYQDASYAAPLDAHLVSNRIHGSGAPFILGVLYDTALPMAKTADFNRRFSGAGFTVEGRYRGFEYLRLGASFSYQNFQDKRDITFRYENATIGGMQLRETSLTTMTANLAFAWDKSDRLIPYLGVRMGPSRMWRRVDIGINRFISETWHLAVTPELGVEFPLRRLLILAALRYNHLFQGGGADAQSYLHFSLGIGFE